MKINTKVVFEWNPESKQYEEIYCDSYDYDGEVSECQNWYNQYMSSLFGGGSRDLPRWGPESQSFGSYPTFTPLPQDPGGPDPMAAFDAANPNPPVQPITPFQTTDYGAMPATGPKGSGQGFIGSAKAMTKEQFGQRAQGFADNAFLRKQEKPGDDFFEDTDFFPGEGVMEGGMFRKGSTGVDLANISGTKQVGGKVIVPGQRGRESALSTGTLAGNFTLGDTPSMIDKGSPTTSKGLLSTSTGKEGAAGLFGGAAFQGGMMLGGALLGGISGYGQAQSQKKGLAKAIGELDPMKSKAFGAYKRSLGLAESYRPGGRYSQYMGGKILSQAEESVGQETSRMIASGITSPSMMRQMSAQSRSKAVSSLPGMEMQVSQMALPYEQLAGEYFGEYRGLGEQLAGLRGAKEAVNPWASAMSGAMGGAMGMGSMFSSFA